MNRKKRGRLVAGAAAIGLLVTPLVTLPAGATPAGDNVVINEVSPGAKFVELYNPTDEAIDLAGMYVSYYSTAGNPQCPTRAELSGSIAAGDYYLIHMAASALDTLPEADAVWGCGNAIGQNGGFGLSVGAPPEFKGNVNHAALGMIDYVGLGSHANFETATATTSGSSATKSVSRSSGVDTDNNSNDFTITDISPGTDTVPPVDPPPVDPPNPNDVIPIADIQGTDAESPLVGETVTTEGFVTAAYPVGGKNGVVIQTPGTGGTTSHEGPSVGVFIYFGSAGVPNDIAIGDFIVVKGTVSEYEGNTQVTSSSWSKVEAGERVAPSAVVLNRLPADDAGKESLENMLVDISGPITVTDNYQSGVNYGEIGAAFGYGLLRQPSDIFNPTRDGHEALEAVDAENAARKIVIDDGRTSNWGTGGTSVRNTVTLPHISTTNPVRTGADVTLVQPVVLDQFRTNWRLQPVEPLIDAANNNRGAEFFVFDNDRPVTPKDVGGDVSISSFNVLNYFTTTAQDAGCTSVYTDRAGNPITANSCDTVRGAANAENLARQQVKIVNAINALDATVVSLEEIENSAKNGKDRDDALATLTDALNEADPSKKWDYVRSPSTANGLPALEHEDVIRTAFIYRSEDVKALGESKILYDQTNFSNARKPLAQEFVALNANGDEFGEPFVVIVNHFKSKGSGTPAPDKWQGNANGDRVNQANALGTWANAQWPDEAVFIVGDLNAYSAEDPILKLNEYGYTRVMDYLAEATGNEAYLELTTYQYQGMHGSLDQALGNAKALEMVNDATVYQINAPEAIALEYSRYNNYLDIYWDESQYRSSDHDPVKIGVKVSENPVPHGATPIPMEGGNVFYADNWAQSIARTANLVGEADQILVGDFDGDGVDTLLLRTGNEYTFLGTNRSESGSIVVTVGAADALAVVGDFNGDAFDDLALRASNSNLFAIHYNMGGMMSTDPGDSVTFGRVSDTPLAGDWNGDGTDTLGLQRGATFFVKNSVGSGAADLSFTYGRVGDRALVGDFDGNGEDTIAIERGPQVYARNALAGGSADEQLYFGRAADERFVGNWFGTGLDTLAAYRR